MVDIFLSACQPCQYDSFVQKIWYVTYHNIHCGLHQPILVGWVFVPVYGGPNDVSWLPCYDFNQKKNSNCLHYDDSNQPANPKKTSEHETWACLQFKSTLSYFRVKVELFSFIVSVKRNSLKRKEEEKDQLFETKEDDQDTCSTSPAHDSSLTSVTSSCSSVLFPKEAHHLQYYWYLIGCRLEHNL